MRAAAPTLTTTTAKLRYISPDARAVLHELHALAIAQQGIEQLLREFVGQLRESEFLGGFFDWMTPLSLTEKEGLVTGPDFAVQLPATTPDGEGFVSMPKTLPSGEAGTAELRATVDGSSFNMTMNEVSNGNVLWDAGTCTRQ